MSFKEWLFSMAEKPLIDNPVINGRWGLLHIITLIISISLIVAFCFIVKKVANKEKARKIIIISLASVLLFFEVVMRFVRFVGYFNELTFWRAVWIIIPRPWCAISSWALMLSLLIRKKFFYNFASMSALLCSVIFFICPGVGFNNQYILFENLYSICTHALLLIMSISLITLKYTSFDYKEIWKEAICFVVSFIYALFVIFVLKMERDPMYFMPNGDIQAGILGIPYGLYLPIYIIFLLIYINAFYLVNDRKNVKQFFKRLKK